MECLILVHREIYSNILVNWRTFARKFWFCIKTFFFHAIAFITNYMHFVVLPEAARWHWPILRKYCVFEWRLRWPNLDYGILPYWERLCRNLHGILNNWRSRTPYNIFKNACRKMSLFTMLWIFYSICIVNEEINFSW